MLQQLFHKFLRVLKVGHHNIVIVLQATAPLQQFHEIEDLHVLQAGHLKMAIVWQVRMRLQFLINLKIFIVHWDGLSKVSTA